MTREEFERGYATLSAVTVDYLYSKGLRAYPCDCSEEGCEGWQMLTEQQAKLYGVVEKLRARVAELAKSQGYVPPPHWESHWDIGSMEEV